LIEQGIADAKRVGIMGGSYGGYATLAGVAFTPDLYAAGVSIVGPSSIPTLLRSIPPYWAPIRKMFAVRVGDLEKPEDMEMLRAQSPLYSAKNIRAPLLVIQGANDPRVVKAESDQIVVALRDLERPVEYLVAPDEGHGFAGRENRIAMYAAVERFLAEHLRGRYQEGMPEPIRARLTALTVDPKTVTLQPAASPSTGSATPTQVQRFDLTRLQPMTTTHSLKVQGNAFGTATSTLQRDGNAWVYRLSVKGGPITQEREVRFGADFTPISSRSAVSQGPVSIVTQLSYANGRVTGSAERPAQMGGTQKIDTAVPAGTLLPGMEEIALMVSELQAGTTMTVPVFNTDTGAPANATLTVAGTENVTTPAGTFATFKVQSTMGAQTSVTWVRTERPHVGVKSELMGGAAVLELQSMK
nr:prolyl oligopeptidase family serine peptidase [Gemmatimonadota bacterium]